MIAKNIIQEKISIMGRIATKPETIFRTLAIKYPDHILTIDSELRYFFNGIDNREKAIVSNVASNETNETSA